MSSGMRVCCATRHPARAWCRARHGHDSPPTRPLMSFHPRGAAPPASYGASPPNLRAGMTSRHCSSSRHGARSHVHKTSGGRVYYMHFVRLPTRTPRATYAYSVRSGGAAAVDSPRFTFRAPYSADGQPTRAPPPPRVPQQ